MFLLGTCMLPTITCIPLGGNLSNYKWNVCLLLLHHITLSNYLGVPMAITNLSTTIPTSSRSILVKRGKQANIIQTQRPQVKLTLPHQVNIQLFKNLLQGYDPIKESLSNFWPHKRVFSGQGLTWPISPIPPTIFQSSVSPTSLGHSYNQIT